MKKNHPSDGILVFDRYYGRKPVPALLALGRAAFCGLVSASAMLYIFSQYELDVPLLNIGFYAGIPAVLLYALFLFVKRRYAVPLLLAAAGALVWLRFDSFWERFSYFVDEAMLLVEGRFLFPRPYLLHPPLTLDTNNPDYRSGILLGSFILCGMFALLCAASMARRVHTVPVVAGFALLCVPKLLSEELEMNMWLLPFVLLVAASVSIELNYRDGIAVTRSDGSNYRMQVREEEKKFLTKTADASLLKRTGMRLSYYSKYATTGLYCAAVFALVFCISCNVFSEGESIDYREIYSAITDFGDDPDGGENADSSVSDYFTSADDEHGRLNIASPGSGDEEILRVTFTGEENIYLRGDIGVDFVDNSWTSHINEDPDWADTTLPQRYRPVELLIMEALARHELGYDITAYSDINIEYLTQTDVVFLPACTDNYSFYGNESFDIFGDYVVRVGDSEENYINSVQCKAVMLAREAGIKAFSEGGWYEAPFNVEDYYGGMFPDIEDSETVLTEYRRYVHEHYTDVPADMYDRLTDFLKSCGYYDNVSADIPLVYSYNAARYLSEYLAENYTYSLHGGNSGEDMLFSFLNETKTGHCSLYASAMTLLLRTEGIPARYCTGFSIYPDSVEGSSVVLKEKNLHAWVEVYLEDFGWVTFDPTSAAVSRLGSLGAVQPPVTRPETTEQRPQPEDTEETEERGEQPPVQAPPEQPSFRIPAWVIAVVIAALIVAAAVVMAVIAWRKLTAAADKAVSGCVRRESKDIYNCIIDIAQLCGLSPEGGQLPVDFYRSCDKALGTSLETIADILEAVTFGSGDISESERELLAKALAQVYSSAVKQGSVAGRYKIRRLVVEKL